MSTKMVYVTGCLGFIGSYVTRTCLARGWHVLGVDSETYAANTHLLDEFRQSKNFTYLRKNINDLSSLYDCDYIINTAAETHVDNSIASSAEFIRSNIDGVHNLLCLMQRRRGSRIPTLLHFSTDEVYGDTIDGKHDESCIMRPSNPYAATKASADLLIQAWHRTHGVPYVIVRPSNNYGIGQHVEKFIPKACKSIMLGRKVPLHNNGTPVRTWLHAGDTADAVIMLIEKGVSNDIINISGNYEDSNINVLRKILAACGKDPSTIMDHADLSYSRPGQDVRYCIDDTKLRSLGWTNVRDFDSELPSVVSYHMGRFTW